MGRQQLNLSNLGAISDGGAEHIINKAIREAAADLDDRGNDDKARVVNVQITMKRRSDGLAEVDVTATARLPPRRTASTVCRPVARDGESRLYFEAFNPENPDQKVLPPMDTDGGEVA